MPVNPPRVVPSYWEDAKRHLRQADATLGQLIHAYEEPPLRSRGDIFQTLLHSIVGQQISVAAAEAIWKRLIALIGSVHPDNVLAQTVEQLRGVGLSARKVEYMRGLSGEGRWVITHDWPQESDESVRKVLCGLRGIGPWTADMVMIFCLLRPDIFPVGDLGLVRSIERRYADGRELTKPELEVIGLRWAPYRTVATWYLWRGLDPEPIEY